MGGGWRFLDLGCRGDGDTATTQASLFFIAQVDAKTSTLKDCEVDLPWVVSRR